MPEGQGYAIYRTSLVDGTVEPMDDLRAAEMVGVTAGYSDALMAEIRVAPTVASRAAHWAASTAEM